MRDRYRERGCNGLFDQRRGKRSYHRIEMESCRLWQNSQFDV
jgi:hypothetical protein